MASTSVDEGFRKTRFISLTFINAVEKLWLVNLKSSDEHIIKYLKTDTNDPQVPTRTSKVIRPGDRVGVKCRLCGIQEEFFYLGLWTFALKMHTGLTQIRVGYQLSPQYSSPAISTKGDPKSTAFLVKSILIDTSEAVVGFFSYYSIEIRDEYESI